jgi:predicted cupin superfamily sugar epimerase
MMNDEIQELIRHFNFLPLPVEGTLFTSTYRSVDNLPNGKPHGTGMIGMYCHEPRSVSSFHKLTIDEMWHFYGGDPLRLILLYPDGSSRDVIMGNEPLKGHHVQFVIPAGVWQAGHCMDGGRYSLFGCTLAPGFTGDIFTGGRQDILLKSHPARKDDILNFGLTGEETEMPEGFAN